MNTNFLAALALLSLGAADLAAAVDNVSSGASTLSYQISSFSSDLGLVGALAVQFTYLPSFTKQISTLQSSLSAATSADVTVSLANKVAGLESSITALLEQLTAKAADFAEVGATTVVTNDVKTLYGPSIKIASMLSSLASGDCTAISIVIDGLQSMDSAFSAAASAYSVTPTAFPTLSRCSTSTTSTSETSTSATSTSETSTSATSTSETSTSATSTSETSTSETSTSASTTSAALVTSSDANGRCIVRPTA